MILSSFFFLSLVYLQIFFMFHVHTSQYQEPIRRGFLSLSKKEHADSRTTLQAPAMDSVNQVSNDTNHPMSINTTLDKT